MEDLSCREKICEELNVGMGVCSDEEAYNICNTYALRKGFSICKGHIRKDASKNIKQREFLCSKEGFQRDEDLFEVKKYNRLETRMGCKFMVRFTVDGGIWKISHINTHHKHELARPEQRQFLRLGRRVSNAQANVINSMVNAGIGPTKTYFYLANEVGGAENIGFTKKDMRNYLQRIKVLLDETTESFIWWFESFKESMGNGQPKTIFTDEDKAIANAIEVVFPHTQHRLCTWHIAKNATHHLSSYCANPESSKGSLINVSMGVIVKKNFKFLGMI
ncbi:protein FAR1-RELATED SEQUENCE 5-like [Olea europaea var. sylvestris]|uniref:protein FAR1-RELATED SEQUENCE 5-like n=1 Tax=Olea europaea var. sylvestris TaxID=158386 RepID=UPI000C1CCE43|nr:protein FAR1-RELATED SEQUENCE 5-like [Olea europaea var. sylvestris]